MATEPDAVNAAGEASALESADIWGEDDAMKQIDGLGADEINLRARMLNSDIHVMTREITRMKHELEPMKEKIAGNIKKIDLNRQLPHLVCNIAEILDLPEEEEEDGAIGDSEAKEGKCVVVKTTTR